MRLTTGIAFCAGLAVASWLSVLDRQHWGGWINEAAVLHQYKADRLK